MNKKSMIRCEEYEIFYDGQADGFDASGGSVVYHDERLDLTFQKASDAEAGISTMFTSSTDLAKTWSKPKPFGPDIIKDPKKEFMGLGLFGPTLHGTIMNIGIHLQKGLNKETFEKDFLWRPCSVIVGRKQKGEADFSYRFYEPHTFLGEQFVAPGLILKDGRILLTIWGSNRKNDNWECGVLISDDDGAHWKYSQVGYEPDHQIRANTNIAAGYNEQTLFDLGGGKVVSLIRGREKLGMVENSPQDTWFLRSISEDGGQTWSKPVCTDIAGTGACSYGLTLPDGSLLFACRIPYARDMVALEDEHLYGLHLARSFDEGKTWTTECIRQHDPTGLPFDNYYNAMNGQFVRIAEDQYLYTFGQFDVKRNIHRILKLGVSISR